MHRFGGWLIPGLLAGAPAAEFSGMRSDDAALPASERSPITLLLAARPWFPEFLRQHRRKSPQRPAASAAALASNRKQAA